MFGLWLNRIRRGFNRSPQELRRRLGQEARAMLDRYRVSPTYGLDDGRFVAQFGVDNFEDFWLQLSDRPYPALTERVETAALDAVISEDSIRILAAAETAMALQVDLLGSGPETLSRPILWDTDFKVEEDWPLKFFRDIDILNPERGSDVKVPWELSRLQWLIPVGQAYMLTGEEKYASFVRDVLMDWIEGNPYGRGVNWTIAMEAAMRIFTWSWFFHVFKKSDAWDGYNFRVEFLRSFFEHAVFCERYIEDYGVNGNHCTADAAALVFAGLFFGSSKQAERWQSKGWQILCQEMPRQVLEDGTNFEGSVGYHRFVAELFFWPARYRRNCRDEVSLDYKQRLLQMAEFTRCYTRPDGLVPLWGDSDDARVLPFGGQSLNDHSYLPDMINAEWEIESAGFSSAEAKAESFWTHGPNSIFENDAQPSTSKAFENSGFYVMATGKDHVFIECGPIGYGGRGGHGHNDCLSFEAFLNGVSLITDSGSFVYSASYEQRNRFRGTAYHNTPMIDGEEQNRFVSEAELFAFQNDAIPEVRRWDSSVEKDIFVGAHSGYQRLARPVTVVREIVLDKKHHRLILCDSFEGDGEHAITIPFHFAPESVFEEISTNRWSINAEGQEFELIFKVDERWQASKHLGWVSPSYGVKIERPVLEFRSEGPISSLRVGIFPKDFAPNDPTAWLDGAL